MKDRIEELAEKYGWGIAVYPLINSILELAIEECENQSATNCTEQASKHRSASMMRKKCITAIRKLKVE